jgi:hypothetical protein
VTRIRSNDAERPARRSIFRAGRFAADWSLARRSRQQWNTLLSNELQALTCWNGSFTVPRTHHRPNPCERLEMATREHRSNLVRRSLGRIRRVNFGRNDARLVLKNPAYRRMLREAQRRLAAGEGVQMTTDELREMLGIEP